METNGRVRPSRTGPGWAGPGRAGPMCRFYVRRKSSPSERVGDRRGTRWTRGNANAKTIATTDSFVMHAHRDLILPPTRSIRIYVRTYIARNSRTIIYFASDLLSSRVNSNERIRVYCARENSHILFKRVIRLNEGKRKRKENFDLSLVARRNSRARARDNRAGGES